jgi:hypothetical protein
VWARAAVKRPGCGHGAQANSVEASAQSGFSTEAHPGGSHAGHSFRRWRTAIRPVYAIHPHHRGGVCGGVGTEAASPAKAGIIGTSPTSATQVIRGAPPPARGPPVTCTPSPLDPARADRPDESARETFLEGLNRTLTGSPNLVSLTGPRHP